MKASLTFENDVRRCFEDGDVGGNVGPVGRNFRSFAKDRRSVNRVTDSDCDASVRLAAEHRIATRGNRKQTSARVVHSFCAPTLHGRGWQLS